MREIFRIGDEFSYLSVGTLDDARLRVELGFGEQRLVRALNFQETTKLVIAVVSWALRATIGRGRNG